ncbi:hypothetical protein [Oscillibacter sp.]|uniref:hypothetical protein n=1 Tax=Oscillibacter sp. TaxID=1945593 RepID=UPI00289D0BE8|nr:hypothetical protein [Oscillibacter sp.]
MTNEEKLARRKQRLKAVGLYLDDLLMLLGGAALVTAAALAAGAAAAFAAAGCWLSAAAWIIARARRRG